MRLRIALLVAAVAAAAAAAFSGARQPGAAAAGTPRVLAVPAGGSLQTALDRARPGDTIVLVPGAVYRGPFLLPVKDGEGWITVRTAAIDRLPPEGTRIAPRHAELLPKIESTTGSVIEARSGAHHFRFVGLEIRPAAGVFLYNLVLLGARESTIESQPSHFVFDRCFLHGDPRRGSRRGIALNSRHTEVIGSWLSDFKEEGADSQAILGWNGAGPYLIANNYLEAAGENVMFGGEDPSVPGLVPSDIRVEGNVFAKPPAWKAGDGAAPRWTVKNLFELKNARRVVVQGNLFERNWAAAQNGFAILFTVRNQNGGAPWATVEDVVFRGNIVRHAGGGINILGHDDNHPSGPARHIVIRDNLFLDIGGHVWGGPGTLFQLLAGTADVAIENNTGLQEGSIVLAAGQPHDRFVFRRNIVRHNEYGIIGSDTGPGSGTLAAHFPGARVEGNVLVGGNQALYPSGNFFPPTLEDVGFADLRGGDLRVPCRATRGCGDAPPAGADFGTLAGALALAAAMDTP